MSIATSLSQINSGVQVIPYHLALDSSNALEIIKQFHVVLDCTDNVATRYLLNDACVLANKPLVSGGLTKLDFLSKNTPIFTKLFDRNMYF